MEEVVENTEIEDKKQLGQNKKRRIEVLPDIKVQLDETFYCIMKGGTNLYNQNDHDEINRYISKSIKHHLKNGYKKVRYLWDGDSLNKNSFTQYAVNSIEDSQKNGIQVTVQLAFLKGKEEKGERLKKEIEDKFPVAKLNIELFYMNDEFTKSSNKYVNLGMFNLSIIQSNFTEYNCCMFNIGGGPTYKEEEANIINSGLIPEKNIYSLHKIMDIYRWSANEGQAKKI